MINLCLLYKSDLLRRKYMISLNILFLLLLKHNIKQYFEYILVIKIYMIYLFNVYFHNTNYLLIVRYLKIILTSTFHTSLLTLFSVLIQIILHK